MCLPVCLLWVAGSVVVPTFSLVNDMWEVRNYPVNGGLLYAFDQGDITLTNIHLHP